MHARKPESTYQRTFDSLFEYGRDAVLAGRHSREIPPVDGGERFGVSVILRPGPELADQLAAVTREAIRVAGGCHWPTGSPASAHFTVRSLEAHRTPIAADDAAVVRYVAAMRAAAGTVRGPVRFTLNGLTLTPRSVMACAEPSDDAADDLAVALEDALGPDGWHEADFNRDIWYVNLVHFAGPVADPAALVDFVARRRRVELGETTAPALDLCRWEFTGSRVEPVSLGSVPLPVVVA